MNKSAARAAIFMVLCFAQPLRAAETISFASDGIGLWVRHARPKMRISRLSATGNRKHMRVEFAFANGARRSLVGTLARQGESSFLITISHAGNSDAQGSIWLESTAGSEISNAYAEGTLDGQSFVAQFTNKPPLRFNFLTEGTGAWMRTGSDAVKLVGAGLMGDMRMQTQLVFFLADGSQRRFGGNVKKQISKPRTLVVALKASGEADASGELRVLLTEKRGILSVIGPGKVDGQAFKVDFQATLEPPDRSAMMEARLGSLRKATGDSRKGDATTQYSAWFDETGVRFIDAVFEQGEYGSSHRKMYFEDGKLVFFSEQGQVRNTAAAAKGQMNLVETAISFAPTGKAEKSVRLVNGKPLALGPQDAVGAQNYAMMLRATAEQKGSTK